MALPCRADSTSATTPTTGPAPTGYHPARLCRSWRPCRKPASLGRIEARRCADPRRSGPPLFKLYILNGERSFFGFYPITKHQIPLPSGPRDIYDLMGKDAVVFHHSAHSADPADAPYVEQARSWFTAMWDNISYEFPT